MVAIQSELTPVLGLLGPHPSLTSEQETHVCEVVGRSGRRPQSQFLIYTERPHRLYSIVTATEIRLLTRTIGSHYTIRSSIGVLIHSLPQLQTSR